jgi:hypothetical protein
LRQSAGDRRANEPLVIAAGNNDAYERQRSRSNAHQPRFRNPEPVAVLSTAGLARSCPRGGSEIPISDRREVARVAGWGQRNRASEWRNQNPQSARKTAAPQEMPRR